MVSWNLLSLKITEMATNCEKKGIRIQLMNTGCRFAWCFPPVLERFNNRDDRLQPKTQSVAARSLGPCKASL